MSELFQRHIDFVKKIMVLYNLLVQLLVDILNNIIKIKNQYYVQFKLVVACSLLIITYLLD